MKTKVIAVGLLFVAFGLLVGTYVQAQPTSPDPGQGGANTSGAAPAGATLVCKGTRLNGTPFTFPFEANTSPAPTAGAACVPSGKTMPKGIAVMGTAPKAAKVFAVVFVPSTTAGGANASGAGAAGATLVCKGTRLNGTPFTFPFEANTSPAPTVGAACVPSGKTMPKGTAVMGTAPKAAKVFAVVFVPSTTAGGANATAGGANTSAAGAAGATLVCQGTRLNGTPFTFPFEANTSPAPTAGAACVPSGKTMPKGTAVMGTAPKAAKIFAVVFVPSTTAGGANTAAVGANTSAAGTAAGATLVCQGTRLNGTPFTFPFEANTSPAPTVGAACVPSGKTMPKGIAAMGTAPKAAKIFAVVFVPSTTAGGANTSAGGANTTAGGTPNGNTQPLANIQPIARNMTEFSKLPQGTARANTYSSTFNNPTKNTPYPDKSSLKLTMVKKPKFGGEGTLITPKLTHDKTKPAEHSTDTSGQQWTCYTDHVQLNATSTTFLNNDYSASASHIYPGAIYTFSNFYNGSYKEQTGQRNPLSIMTDSTNIKGSSYVTVANPNMGTIRNAVDGLFRETTNAVANESTTFQIYENSNEADQSIKISGGASGYGASLGGGYGTASQSNTVTFTIDAIKTLFSINTIPPTNGFFTDPKMEATPNLMVIGNVNYGMRVLANFSATFNSQDEQAEFNAKYSGWGVSAHVAFDQISKNQSVSDTINAYIVGGPASSTVKFSKKDLEAEITKLMSGATYKNAQPVKYEFYDMAGDVVGSNSATDSFPVRNCVPGKDDPRLESVVVSFEVAGDGKNPDDNYQLLLYPGTVNLDKGVSEDFVFVYDQSQTPEAGLEYKSQTNYTVKLEQVKPATLSQFKNGGALLLNIYPNGNDTWENKTITVTLNFEGAGGTGPKNPLTFSNVTIDQNGPRRILYFDGNFKAMQ